MKTHLLDDILDLRSSQSEVLESTNDRPIESSIRSRRTIRCRKLGLRINRRSGGLAVKHAGALQELVSILLLMKEEAIRSPNNLNAKKVMQSTQVLDGKLVTQPESNLLKKGCGGGRQDNVVNVEE